MHTNLLKIFTLSQQKINLCHLVITQTWTRYVLPNSYKSAVFCISKYRAVFCITFVFSVLTPQVRVWLLHTTSFVCMCICVGVFFFIFKLNIVGVMLCSFLPLYFFSFGYVCLFLLCLF